MSPKDDQKVISLEHVRAMRAAVEQLHSPEMRDIVYEGASGEFKRIIAPVIRSLLEIKGAPEEFQQELITLLEKVYATHHLDELLEKAT